MCSLGAVITFGRKRGTFVASPLLKQERPDPCAEFGGMLHKEGVKCCKARLRLRHECFSD
eukprot:4506614-Amphidinium_carterae.1